MDTFYTPGIVQAPTVPAPLSWTIIDTVNGDLDTLEEGRLHAVAGHPDLAIAVILDPRRYVVIHRWCPHRPRNARKPVDLTMFGKVRSAEGELTCRHLAFCWKLSDGTSGPDGPNLTIVPSKLHDDRLMIVLPPSPA